MHVIAHEMFHRLEQPHDFLFSLVNKAVSMPSSRNARHPDGPPVERDNPQTSNLIIRIFIQVLALHVGRTSSNPANRG